MGSEPGKGAGSTAETSPSLQRCSPAVLPRDAPGAPQRCSGCSPAVLPSNAPGAPQHCFPAVLPIPPSTCAPQKCSPKPPLSSVPPTPAARYHYTICLIEPEVQVVYKVTCFLTSWQFIQMFQKPHCRPNTLIKHTVGPRLLA